MAALQELSGEHDKRGKTESHASSSDVSVSCSIVFTYFPKGGSCVPSDTRRVTITRAD